MPQTPEAQPSTLPAPLTATLAPPTAPTPATSAHSPPTAAKSQPHSSPSPCTSIPSSTPPSHTHDAITPKPKAEAKTGWHAELTALFRGLNQLNLTTHRTSNARSPTTPMTPTHHATSQGMHYSQDPGKAAEGEVTDQTQSTSQEARRPKHRRHAATRETLLPTCSHSTPSKSARKSRPVPRCPAPTAPPTATAAPQSPRRTQRPSTPRDPTQSPMLVTKSEGHDDSKEAEPVTPPTLPQYRHRPHR